MRGAVAAALLLVMVQTMMWGGDLARDARALKVVEQLDPCFTDTLIGCDAGPWRE